uniref:acylphosphatase n=1 Tax=Cyprinus carpio carpio TaxID=630221 RepID=A0A9J8D5K7_CYPCA
MSSEELLSVDYEVFGRVQGVFSRKYTQVMKSYHAQGLVESGWVWSAGCRTLMLGRFEGSCRVWPLKSSRCSPQSRITKAEFRNEHAIDKLDFKDFKVVC